MVWINNEHYNAKSYPREAYGGAMCLCARCAKSRENKAVIDKEKRRLRDALIRMTNALVDDGKRAGGLWQDDITND
jgi:hypothetical protein